MDEKELRNEARLIFIEYLLAHVLKRQYERMALTDEVILSHHDELIAKLAHETFPGIDPAMSDHFASEIEDAARRFVNGLEEMMGLDRKNP